MTGYLDRLAARLVEPRSHIRPRPLSRFEVVDAPAAFVDEAGTSGEADALPMPSRRAQTPLAAEDRSEAVRHFASDTPPHVEATGTTPDRQPAPITKVVPATPSTLDASTAEAKQVRAPSRQDRVVPAPETVEVPQLHSSVSHRAMSAAAPASVPATPTAKDAAVPPAIEDRISHWRAPVERLAEAAIDTRTPAQAAQPTPMPRQRDRPEAAAVDDGPSVVQVTIGRLEVRAPEPPRQPAAKPKRAAPRMSLQDYLQRRTEGRAR
ncbi:hypothetical protein [Variovorax sp. YR216]|uniref:hypothetical protein n=1 Tax=Variovorax sp. YR216 TaxID=1882828 RepID=UPI00089A2876|nr:hypothetical protein [Variovorax sp. YR216]SEB20113.1 hypothetical protein SAMN05444680_11366 [Variovorax sp. YR216]